MHQITAYEFRVIQSDGASWIARPFPFGGKDGLPFVNRKYPAVGNGNLVRIPSKIFNGVAETVEGFLYVRTPVLAVKAITEFRPVVRVTQLLAGGRESEFLAFIKRIEAREVFPFNLSRSTWTGIKKLPEDFRILWSAVNPPPETIQCICTW